MAAAIKWRHGAGNGGSIGAIAGGCCAISVRRHGEKAWRRQLLAAWLAKNGGIAAYQRKKHGGMAAWREKRGGGAWRRRGSGTEKYHGENENKIAKNGVKNGA